MLDLAAIAGDDDAFSMVVSSVRRVPAGDVIGMLDAIPSRQSLRSVGKIYSGVVLKSARPITGFVADSRNQRIETLTVSGDQLSTSSMATIPDADAVLGPLCMDSDGANLYVADLNLGNLWKVPTRGGKPSLFATGLRDVRALAANDHWVFAADGDSRRILQFAQGLPQNAPRQTAASARSLQPAELRSPSAVTTMGSGQIAVGDPVASAVFVVNIQDEKIAGTIR